MYLQHTLTHRDLGLLSLFNQVKIREGAGLAG